MQVLISGASGFIGRRLRQALAAASHGTAALSRDPSRVPAELAGADAVVNLAGEPIAARRWTAARKERIRESRVNVTRALASAIASAERKPSVFVSASAVGYYGPRGDEEIDESTPPPATPDFLSRVCQDWEREARAAEPHTRVVLLRTGIVLGKGGGALAKMLLPFRMGVGGPVGTGRQWMSWIHMDDEVGLILHALGSEAVRGPLNATAPSPVTNADLSHALGRALHRPSFMVAPAFALRLALGEMADMLLTGQRVLPRAALASGYRFRHPELQGALRALLPGC